MSYYLVHGEEQDHYYDIIIGLFSTRKKAIRALKKAQAENPYILGFDLKIDKLKLNKQIKLGI